MEEKDLKDMSQSELISLIMKLNKKQVTAPKTKVVISPVPKPRKVKIVDDDEKPVRIRKQKVKYNLDNLFNDEELDSKPNVNTIDIYPKQNVSLHDFKMSELRIAKRSVNEKGTTFINLFEKRLSKTSNTEKASTVIDVDIFTPNRSDVEKGYSRIPKEDPTGVDKFEVSYKKVKKQAATGGRVHKSCGPFMADLPNLSREDMYKFAMFTLLKNTF